MMFVLVIREAGADAPAKVIRCDDADEITAVIDSHYPGAELDGRDGFEHPSSDRGYYYDHMPVTE